MGTGDFGGLVNISYRDEYYCCLGLISVVSCVFLLWYKTKKAKAFDEIRLFDVLNKAVRRVQTGHV